MLRAVSSSFIVRHHEHPEIMARGAAVILQHKTAIHYLYNIYSSRLCLKQHITRNISRNLEGDWSDLLEQMIAQILIAFLIEEHHSSR